MTTVADHTSVLVSNRKTIATISIVFVAGTVLFWNSGSQLNWSAFFGALLVSAVAGGLTLGYRCQKLGNFRLSVAYPVSWRIACVWVALSASVEFLFTDQTISFTVDVLSPYIFISAVVMMLMFFTGWLTRRIAVEFRNLARTDWFQLVGILFGAAGLIVAIWSLSLSFQSVELQKPELEEFYHLQGNPADRLVCDDGNHADCTRVEQ